MFYRNLKNILKIDQISLSLNFFEKAKKRIYYGLVLIQVLLSLLDLIAILLLGALTNIALFGISGFQINVSVQKILIFLKLSDQPFQMQVAILGVLVAIFLLLKTFLSLRIFMYGLDFLRKAAINVSNETFDNFFKNKFFDAISVNPQRITYMFTRAIPEIIVVSLGSFMTIIADFALCIILFISLFIIEPMLALFVFILLSIIVILVFYLLNNLVVSSGEEERKSHIELSTFVSETLQIIRQIRISGLSKDFNSKFNKINAEKLRVDSKISLIPMLNKYIMEFVLVISAFAVVSFEILFFNTQKAVSGLAIFLASATRILPSLLRIQQSVSKLTISREIAEDFFRFNYEVSKSESELDSSDYKKIEVAALENFRIIFTDVSYKYPNHSNFALENLSFTINKNDFTSIVGPSGAGKTTLVELLLGFMKPTNGEIQIGGNSVFAFIQRNPGFIGYVPQTVPLISGNIAQNISLQENLLGNEFKIVENLISSLDLNSFLDKLPQGIETNISNYAEKLSGGEKQRIGIARALFRQPKILILDEATSSLDAITEEKIQIFLEKLRGSTTLILIAHRLSTIKKSDRIFYLENGKLVAADSFENLRLKFPNFATQANLLGI